MFREDKQRFCWATVVEVDRCQLPIRICFRFPRIKDDYIEWLDFGSPHICTFKSKVNGKDRNRKELKQDVNVVASNPIDGAGFSIDGKSYGM